MSSFGSSYNGGGRHGRPEMRRRAPTSYNQSMQSFKSYAGQAQSMGAGVHQEQYKGGVRQTQPLPQESEIPESKAYSKEMVMGLAIAITLCHSGLMFGVVPMVSALKKIGDSTDENPFYGSTNEKADGILANGHMITSFGAFLVGPVPDKFGPRFCAIAGFIIEIVGQVLLSQVTNLPEFCTIVGYGFLGLGGTMVLMSTMGFADAFKGASLLLAILTGAFDAGGLVFMLLPYLPEGGWQFFFLGYAGFAAVCALAVFLIFPDENLPAYSEDDPENSDLAEMGAAFKEKTLMQVLLRPGMIMFLLTFTITGSAWVYGDSAFGSVIGFKDEYDNHDTMLNIWQPLIASSTFPVCVLVGHLAEKYGIGVAAFLNILCVQLFLVGLWLFNLNGQFATMIFFNFAGGSMFTTQNLYVCQEGYNHVGTVYGVTNLVMAIGNTLDSFWLNKNPLGPNGGNIESSLPFGCIFWLVATCPMYVWPVYEFIQARRIQTEFEQLKTASFSAIMDALPPVQTQLEVKQPIKPSSKPAHGFPLLHETNLDAENGNSSSGNDPFMENQARMERQLHRAIAAAQGTTPAISWNPVITVNPQNWNAKVQHMLQAGKDKIFFVVDFDKTITTRFLENGSRAFDSHDILASCPKITWGCKRMMELLLNKYHPIEVDTRMTREEKSPHMVEWGQLVNQLLISQGVTRDDLEMAVRECMDFRIRKGVEELFQIAHKNNIPLIVVSAGYGNIIEEVISQCINKSNGELGTPWDNLFILSNSMLWNADGRLAGFSTPPVHMFNKDLRSAPERLQAMIQGRDVGVLCGDGLGDLTMATGHSTTSLLKVGFLNDRVDDLMAHYCRETAYDRVIVGDGTFEPLLDVLRQL